MKKKHLISAVLLCAAGIAASGLYCGLTTRQYTVSTELLPAGERIRIVMLSDLHSYVYGKDQQPLLDRVRGLKPDLIVLCGDIVDDKQPTEGAELLLSQIAAIAPCYYVSGNHEFWADEPQEIFRMIESYGVRVLHDTRETVRVGNSEIVLCGVDDPAGYGSGKPGSTGSYGSRAQYQAVLSMFDDLPEDRFTVLLAHRPEYIAEYAAHQFDLALCGHAHGGQWRIPFLMNGLIAPNQGFFPQYAGGQYEYGELTQIVGRGLVCDWKPRVFNPPEVVAVDITGSEGSP